MSSSTFVYVAYISATPQELWSALTDTELMRRYWFGLRCESRWTAGSPWKIVCGDDQILDSGEIVDAVPPRSMLIRWQHQRIPELKAEGPSLCKLELERHAGAVKLSITHGMARERSKLIELASGSWPLVISNLKSLLETGSVVLQHLPQVRAHSTLEKSHG